MNSPSDAPEIPPDEKRKVLNDLDARTLVESNVDIRHQETVGLATLALLVTFSYYMSQTIHFPTSAELNPYTPGCPRVRAIVWTLGPKFFFVVPMFGCLLAIIGAILRRNTREAEGRIQSIYQNIAVCNQIRQADFVSIQDFIIRSRRRGKKMEISTIRRVIPGFVLLFGLLYMFLPLFYEIVAGLACNVY